MKQHSKVNTLTRFLAITGAGMLLLLTPSSAQAKDKQDDSANQLRTQSGMVVDDLPDDRVEQLYDIYWKMVARRYAAFEDGFVACPAYDVKFPSSRGMTVQDVIRENTQTVTVHINNMITKDKKITPPREDAEAYANALPKLAVGEYGYIHSCQIEQITGTDEMLAEEIWLIDADAVEDEIDNIKKQIRRRDNRNELQRELERRFELRQQVVDYQEKDKSLRDTVRIKDFSTTGLVEDERWNGPSRRKDGIQVAVVKMDTIEKRNKKIKQYVLAPASIFNRGGISREEFEQLLNDRQVDKRWFVYQILEAKRENESTWPQVVIEQLEQQAQAVDTDG